MRTFVNRKDKDYKVIAHDIFVREGKDAYYLMEINVSLPKADWKEISPAEPQNSRARNR